MMRIAILAASPQEYRPFQRQLGKWRSLARRPFPMLLHRAPDKEVFLVETGMGRQPAVQAADHVLSLGAVDLLLSVGFAGSLWPSLRLGQVVWTHELAISSALPGTPAVLQFRSGLAPRLSVFREVHRIRPVRIVTLDSPQPKATLAQHFSEIPTIVDLESASLATVAHARGVPFLGLRVISDELSDEIGWDLNIILDDGGRVRIPKVIAAVFKQPVIMASFYHLWRNAQVAGRNLAQTLTALLWLPAPELRALTGELQLLPVAGLVSEPPANGEIAPGGAKPAPP